MAFIPDKPMHNKYVFRDLNGTQYKLYATGFSNAKAGGVRAIQAWMTGVGVVGVIKDIGKGVIIDYGKRKFAIVCLSAASYVASPAVVVVTNSTKLIRIAKSIHSAAAFIWECGEDMTNLAFLPLDLVLFGQPIPIGAPNRFNLFNNCTDFLDV